MRKKEHINRFVVHSGFTLLELLVSVSIALILATVAVPAFSSMIRGNSLSSYASELSTSLLLAKSEATKRSEIVTLTFQAGTDWSDGWRINDSTGTLIKQFDGIDAIYSASASSSSLGFHNDGTTTTSSEFNIILKPVSGCTNDLVKVIRISVIGTISVTDGTCS